MNSKVVRISEKDKHFGEDAIQKRDKLDIKGKVIKSLKEDIIYKIENIQEVIQDIEYKATEEGLINIQDEYNDLEIQVSDLDDQIHDLKDLSNKDNNIEDIVDNYEELIIKIQNIQDNYENDKAIEYDDDFLTDTAIEIEEKIKGLREDLGKRELYLEKLEYITSDIQDELNNLETTLNNYTSITGGCFDEIKKIENKIQKKEKNKKDIENEIVNLKEEIVILKEEIKGYKDELDFHKGNSNDSLDDEIRNPKSTLEDTEDEYYSTPTIEDKILSEDHTQKMSI